MAGRSLSEMCHVWLVKDCIYLKANLLQQVSGGYLMRDRVRFVLIPLLLVRRVWLHLGPHQVQEHRVPIKDVPYLKVLNAQFFHQCFSSPDGTGAFPDSTLHQTQTARFLSHTNCLTLTPEPGAKTPI